MSKYRRSARVMRGAFEGATTGFRFGRKGLTQSGPNSANLGSLETLRSRSRDAARNNPVALSTVQSYVANLVGTGAVARWPDKVLQELWGKWVNECDADGKLSFNAMQAVVGRQTFVDGEALGRFRYRRDDSRFSVPVQLQLLEADYLDAKYTMVTNGKRIIAGKQLDGTGRTTHYHLFKHHPADHTAPLSFSKERVAVSARDVVHPYKVDRPGQLRGTPALSSVLLLLHELDQMVDAAVVRAKLAELFGAFVETADGEQSPLGQELNGTDPDGEEFTDPARPPLTGITSGALHYLEPGEKVVFADPPKLENLDSVLKYALRIIARVAHLTYEQVSGDLAGVTFSALRAGLVEARRQLEMVQQDLIINQFCRPVAQRWLYIAAASGRWSAPDDYWLDPQAYMPKWMMPKFRHVQPLEETRADVLEVRAGFSPRAEKQMERGYWPDDINEQLAEEQGDELILDTNPAVTAANGKIQGDAEPDPATADEPMPDPPDE